MKKLINAIVKPLKSVNKGQGIVEYGFILILIALAVIVALGTLGQHVLNFFNEVPNKLSL